MKEKEGPWIIIEPTNKLKMSKTCKSLHKQLQKKKMTEKGGQRPASSLALKDPTEIKYP